MLIHNRDHQIPIYCCSHLCVLSRSFDSRIILFIFFLFHIILFLHWMFGCFKILIIFFLSFFFYIPFPSELLPFLCTHNRMYFGFNSFFFSFLYPLIPIPIGLSKRQNTFIRLCKVK